MAIMPKSGRPSRPMLLPGVRVVRRDSEHLQVGLGERRVVAADTPDVRALLAALADAAAAIGDHAIEPGAGPAAGLRDLLVARELLVDGAAALGALTSAAERSDPHHVAATLSECGDDGPRVLADRKACAVEVADSSAAAEGAACRQLLDRAGFRAATGQVAGPRPAVGLLVSRGEPGRELVDGWLRDDIPHLVVTCVEARVTVGPFVVPGRTPCLRCIDAHRAERDPRHALVVEQYAGTSAGLVPEPVPLDLWGIALHWAVRDVATWVAGGRPRTWAATIVVDPRLELPETRWRPHAGCGCGWPQAIPGRVG